MVRWEIDKCYKKNMGRMRSILSWKKENIRNPYRMGMYDKGDQSSCEGAKKIGIRCFGVSFFFVEYVYFFFMLFYNSLVVKTLWKSTEWAENECMKLHHVSVK